MDRFDLDVIRLDLISVQSDSLDCLESRSNNLVVSLFRQFQLVVHGLDRETQNDLVGNNPHFCATGDRHLANTLPTNTNSRDQRKHEHDQ